MRRTYYRGEARIKGETPVTFAYCCRRRHSTAGAASRCLARGLKKELVVKATATGWEPCEPPPNMCVKRHKPLGSNGWISERVEADD